MPLAFPSHQGLLAPLWRRWPSGIAVLPLWVGAFVPDPIDGIAHYLVHGELGQGFGHTLLGTVAVDLPVGLLLLSALRRAAPWLAKRSHRLAHRLGGYLVAVDGQGNGGALHRLGRDAFAMAIGSVSHLLFDLLSHERARLLWPFADDPDWMPAWWRTVWFRQSAPGYPDYPIGPHFVAWVGLTGLGVWMFLRYRPRR